MGSNTKIQWAHHTFNPWRGCAKVAAGCVNCYAEAQSKRNPKTLGVWGPNGTRVVASEAMWRQPFKWNRDGCPQCKGHGVVADWVGTLAGDLEQSAKDCSTCLGSDDFRPRVFCGSLCDVFEDWGGEIRGSSGGVMWDAPGLSWQEQMLPGRTDGIMRDGGGRRLTLADARARLFRLIDSTQSLDWLLLTKRPENVRRMWPEKDPLGNLDPIASAPYGDPMRFRRDNVWLGTSIACQEDADRNIPELLKCRDLCAKTFLSIEPLVGPVDLSQWIGYNPLHENNTQRRSGVRGGQNGAPPRARGRFGVEDEVPSQKSLGRESDDNGREESGTCGCSVRPGVSTGQDNDGRTTSDVLGASSCVAALQRSDSDRNADKPQGRQQVQQRSSQPGNVLGVQQHETCQQGGIGVAKGIAEQSQQTVSDGCGGDSPIVCGRQGNSIVNCGEVRDIASSSIENSSRGSDAGRVGSNGGLCASSAPRDTTRREGAISLVIVGGESGPNARPCDIEWIRSIVRQCLEAGVPVFVKQIGSRPDGLRFRMDDKGKSFCEEHSFSHGKTTPMDPKGGDPAEWPEDVRVREVP